MDEVTLDTSDWIANDGTVTASIAEFGFTDFPDLDLNQIVQLSVVVDVEVQAGAGTCNLDFRYFDSLGSALIDNQNIGNESLSTGEHELVLNDLDIRRFSTGGDSFHIRWGSVTSGKQIRLRRVYLRVIYEEWDTEYIVPDGDTGTTNTDVLNSSASATPLWSEIDESGTPTTTDYIYNNVNSPGAPRRFSLTSPSNTYFHLNHIIVGGYVSQWGFSGGSNDRYQIQVRVTDSSGNAKSEWRDIFDSDIEGYTPSTTIWRSVRFDTRYDIVQGLAIADYNIETQYVHTVSKGTDNWTGTRIAALRVGVYGVVASNYSTATVRPSSDYATDGTNIQNSSSSASPLYSEIDETTPSGTDYIKNAVDDPSGTTARMLMATWPTDLDYVVAFKVRVYLSNFGWAGGADDFFAVGMLPVETNNNRLNHLSSGSESATVTGLSDSASTLGFDTLRHGYSPSAGWYDQTFGVDEVSNMDLDTLHWSPRYRRNASMAGDSWTDTRIATVEIELVYVATAAATFVDRTMSAAAELTGASSAGTSIASVAASATGELTGASSAGTSIAVPSMSATGELTGASSTGTPVAPVSMSATGELTAASTAGFYVITTTMSATGALTGAATAGTSIAPVTTSATGTLAGSGSGYTSVAVVSASAAAELTSAASTGVPVMLGTTSATGELTAASTPGFYVIPRTMSATGELTGAATIGTSIVPVTTGAAGELTGASTTGTSIAVQSASATAELTAASSTGVSVALTSASATGELTGASSTGTSIAPYQANATGTLTGASSAGTPVTSVSTSATGELTASSSLGVLIGSYVVNYTGTLTAASVPGNEVEPPSGFVDVTMSATATLRALSSGPKFTYLVPSDPRTGSVEVGDGRYYVVPADERGHTAGDAGRTYVIPLDERIIVGD